MSDTRFMLNDIIQLYKNSKKPTDINWFTEWICRPPAAVIVYILKNTPITPNQVTLISAIVCLVASLVFVTIPTYQGLVIGALIYQFSFILDCVDGQLARIRQIASPLGHLFDFTMDEIKALMIFGAIAIRLWIASSNNIHLLIGLIGLFIIAAGIALTSFTRRSEYLEDLSKNNDISDNNMDQSSSILLCLEKFFKFVIHYPQYFWVLALLDLIEIYLYSYAAVSTLYLGYISLSVIKHLCIQKP